MKKSDLSLYRVRISSGFNRKWFGNTKTLRSELKAGDGTRTRDILLGKQTF